MHDVQGTILGIVESLLSRAGRADATVTPDSRLHGDGSLGLDSLQTAELSAILEEDLGTDPFSAGVIPETIGEIVAFYGADDATVRA